MTTVRIYLSSGLSITYLSNKSKSELKKEFDWDLRRDNNTIEVKSEKNTTIINPSHVTHIEIEQKGE